MKKKLTKAERTAAARELLWRQGNLEWKLSEPQLEIYKLYKTFDQRKLVLNSSRRFGKCVAEGTEILTPFGPKKIEEISVGDVVYGYNADGSVSETKVVAVENQGIKDVVSLTKDGKEVVRCTPEHRWRVKNKNIDRYNPRLQTLETRQLKSYTYILRKQVPIPCGRVYEPHAYAIGAMLGNGSTKPGSTRLSISQETEEVPLKVASCIGARFCYRAHPTNYNWVISHQPKGTKAKFTHSDPVNFHYYENWIKGRRSWEKFADWAVIDQWDRTSCLNFLAGLLDTDGHVGPVPSRPGTLRIEWAMQAKTVIEAVQQLIYKLFQYKSNDIIINSQKLLKNGPIYSIRLGANAFTKLILKELDPYLQNPKRKWRSAYESFSEGRVFLDEIGVKYTPAGSAPCWDIQVDNDTNLYLLANGLVTHNSHLLCTTAISECLSNPGFHVSFVSPTKVQSRKIIVPLFRQILKDCPEDLRPIWHAQEQSFKFQNGSSLDVAGADAGGAEGLRGISSNLCIVDEAAIVADLEYLIQSILLPLTISTNGKLILASTPSPLPRHAFESYCQEAEKVGAYVHKTIYDNPLIPRGRIAEYMKESGGESSTVWQREYLARFVRDENLTVLPEFTPELERQVIGNVPRPSHFDAYVSMDVGFEDLTAVLFGYWEFTGARLVVEDELVYNRMRTDVLADGIKDKELTLWGKQKPYFRISDVDLILINDLKELHGLSFVTAEKDNKESSVNELRVALQDRKIVISPRCTNLIQHLRSAIWNTNRTSFARVRGLGHFDFVDALIYLLRNVRRHHNPFPAESRDPATQFFIPSKKPTGKNAFIIKSMFPFLKREF